MKLGLGLGLITAINAGGPGARKCFVFVSLFFFLAPTTVVHAEGKLTLF
jgi:hypothetical protein